MLLPGRHGAVDSYRYGFQGQEKDDEIKGEGNSLNYKYRMHDPRLGRFFAIDPLAKQYPFYSPYQFSGNKVISHRELEGGEELVSILPPDNKSFFSAVNGKGLQMSIITKGLENIGEKATAFSYTFAYKELAKGKLMGTNGKVYTVNELVVRDYNMVDGTVVENITMAKNNRGNQYFNTTQINQIEAFRNKTLKHAGKILENAGNAWGVIQLVKDAANNDGQIDATSLMGTGITTYIATTGGFAPALATGAVLDIIKGEADRAIDEVKQDRRSFIINFSANNSLLDIEGEVGNGLIKDNFEVINMPTSILGEFLTGQIKTKEDLYNAIWSDENALLQRDSAILIEYTDDNKKVYVHRVYLNTENQSEVNTSKDN
ncbi:RHS repeat-associated core domain-containing protein [Flavobacterium sp. CS20]|uniref:RHS repeat-associated core domain-containing protein n=1 Tax=Flavobacterium sp. CS20 TaxID=2775246 RepID=UPI001B3A19B1|nr:RHS repeat-associated core domain-containing protein [Flavobacterium sp. CS20]QTY27311.1 hypothetical protein IGB25_01640 [Flavobacterium sp. CS20]